MSITDTTLAKESQDKYLTYALSVVSGRALPDVRDGLKPVQRRILYAMFQNLKLNPSGSHRKSAAVVGEVLGHYHPHGDIACYEAMVRMAQDFSLRYPLVDGQGNFGSIDGDNPAAYRYTEARLKEIALEVMGEINQETVGYRDNFDATTREPIVLPSRLPNLLVNGASGIAVGMATSIPPHNLREVVNAMTALLADPEIKNSQLVTIVKAPDFPSGCSILNSKKELDEIYRTGRGNIRMRGDWEEEEGSRGKRFIIIKSLPYTINKATLVEKIADLILAKKVPQLVDVRDESTDEVRVVLELASGADPKLAIEYLYKHTPLESNFQVNLTALVPIEGSMATRPELLSLKDCMQHFLNFRQEVVRNRLSYERKKLLERIHILEGLAIVYDNLDKVLKIVRASDGRTDAAQQLMKAIKLSEIQAYAVVDMRIYQISRTSIKEIREELAQKLARVKEIEALLANEKAIRKLIGKELEELAEKYGDRRRCKLVKDFVDVQLDEQAFIVDEDVYAIVTRDGWVKRIRQNNELSSTRIREGDQILRAHPVSTRDSVLFFTNLGNVYVLSATDFPSSSGYGDPVQKFLKFKDNESVIESFALFSPRSQEQLAGIAKYEYSLADGQEVVLVSRSGKGSALKLEGLADVKRNGKRVMKVKDDDGVSTVCILNDKLAMFTRQGFGLEISRKEIPSREGASVGVALINIGKGDQLQAALSYYRTAKFSIQRDAGPPVEIENTALASGHRALKGQKVISRGTIVSVTRG